MTLSRWRGRVARRAEFARQSTVSLRLHALFVVVVREMRLDCVGRRTEWACEPMACVGIVHDAAGHEIRDHAAVAMQQEHGAAGACGGVAAGLTHPHACQSTVGLLGRHGSWLQMQNVQMIYPRYLLTCRARRLCCGGLRPLQERFTLRRQLQDDRTGSLAGSGAG